ncbi:PREDICTED: GDP-L-galactose phosphorylase 1-like isoform X3 [Prunus mume]|uniref:GDP-L-galactose phosphorylase 1-like isoform X3 n=1 Tax=Prunus mume TaxID=102107 RepID=A0ABM0NJ87_PRUMU|nr:PREDICTED: GDP-L-galactose phosphorylase 1-like isoform X3 [Prunus mume]
MVTVEQLQDDNFLSQCPPPLSLQGIFSDIRIPLYRFGSNSVLDNGSVGGISCLIEEEQSVLDSILLAQWEDRMWKGLFRYDVTTSEIKVIGGRRKFIAQFNEGWSRDCMPKLGKNKIRHQKDVFEFSWMERQEELLFCVASGEKLNPELVLSAAVPDCGLLITINSSPVEYGHVFLVPHSSYILHQFLDARSLELVLRVAVEVNNCSFRLFYDYSPSASHIYFQEKLIPYNLLISDHGKRIFLFFQLHTSENFCTLSAWECGGYFVVKSRSEFDQATEHALLKQLTTVSLDDEGFQGVKRLCCTIASKFAS